MATFNMDLDQDFEKFIIFHRGVQNVAIKQIENEEHKMIDHLFVTYQDGYEQDLGDPYGQTIRDMYASVKTWAKETATNASADAKTHQNFVDFFNANAEPLKTYMENIERQINDTHGQINDTFREINLIRTDVMVAKDDIDDTISSVQKDLADDLDNRIVAVNGIEKDSSTKNNYVNFSDVNGISKNGNNFTVDFNIVAGINKIGNDYAVDFRGADARIEAKLDKIKGIEALTGDNQYDRQITPLDRTAVGSQWTDADKSDKGFLNEEGLASLIDFLRYGSIFHVGNCGSQSGSVIPIQTTHPSLCGPDTTLIYPGTLLLANLPSNTADNPMLSVNYRNDNKADHTLSAPIYYQGSQITTGEEKKLLKGWCLFLWKRARSNSNIDGYWKLLAHEYDSHPIVYTTLNAASPSGTEGMIWLKQKKTLDT